MSKPEAGLSVQRILQDLKEEGYTGSYHSVHRFVTRVSQMKDPFISQPTRPQPCSD